MKYPLSYDFSKTKKLYLNITAKNNSLNFSMDSPINLTKPKKINLNKNKEKKINKAQNKDNLLIRNELKKIFFNNYINNRLNLSNNNSKEKEKKNRFFWRLKKSNKSKDFSFFYQKNKSKNLSSKDVNDLMTSGSIDENENGKSEEKYWEINPEEIHFNAVKYYQEIKINFI